MDLVAGVRKEGSRGGRGDFKWEDVRDSQHRENYLGHSLMAPVGRWQKNKDLNWYAKGDKSAAALSAAEARKEEIRRIKEAEESALSEALGYGPTMKSNPNETPIGKKEVEKAIKDMAEGDEEDGAKGVGFGAFVGGAPMKEERDVLPGSGLEEGPPAILRERLGDDDARRERRRRSRGRDQSRERRHRRHDHGEATSHRRHRSSERPHYRRERSRSFDRRRGGDRPSRRPRDRSHSPDLSRRRRSSRHRDYDYRR